MIINFRQGIVSYDLTTTPFSASGTFVSIVVGSQPLIVTIAQSTSNYSYAETTSQSNCWVVPNATQPYWLYWDFNSNNFARTFGYTTLQPVIGATAPTNPAIGQMWYNTSTFRNYEYTTGGWTEVLRVFAAQYEPTYPAGMQLISMGDHVPLNSITPDYRGTQIGYRTEYVDSGSIINDYTGLPIRKNDGTFFTTEDVVFSQNAAITALRLESNVYTATSTDIGIITQYQVVALQPDGSVQLASYNDAGTTAIGMAIQTITPGGTGAICLEGTVTNTVGWNWAGNIGGLLWVSGVPGALQPTDPHIDNPAVYPIPRVPVARILSPTAIIFLQGIGTKGDPGIPGTGGGGTTVPATPVIAGVVTLSTDGGTLLNPTNVVISELDPRLTNARVALASSILPASNITVAPDAGSGTTAPNVQLALQSLGNTKLNLTGGTLTGNLILNADPTSNFQAVTKQYVDNNFLSENAQVVEIAGSTMTGPLILSGNPTQPLQATTKQYVDSVASGLTVQAPAQAATTGSNLNAAYAGNPNYSLSEIGNGPLIIDGVTLATGNRVLVKDQTIGSQNGIYAVTDPGSAVTPWILTRDNLTYVSGTFLFIEEGTLNSGSSFVLTTPNPITLDVTPLTFVLFSSVAALTSNDVTSALGYVPVGPFSVTSNPGISVSGSPVQGSAPSGVVLSVSTELLGLNSLSTLGVVQRTGTGSYIAAGLTSSQITTALGYTPLSGATINTTAPLAGGGSLSGTLTLSINPFTGTGPGAVPASPGGTAAFLRADGSWSIPPGGSGGGVSSVGVATTTTGLIIGGTNPVTAAGVISVNLNTELQGLSQLSTLGVLQRTGAGTYTAAPYVITLTGDVLASGATPIATTLATVNSNPGTFGNVGGTIMPIITVNAKGLATAVTQTPISISGLLPTQTGNAGDFLTTDGTNISWGPAVTAPAGSNQQVQFNNAGAFGASSNFTYNTSTGALSLTPTTGNNIGLYLNASPVNGGEVLGFIAPTDISVSALGLYQTYIDTQGILGYVGFERVNSNNLALSLLNVRPSGTIALLTAGGQAILDQHGSMIITPNSGYVPLQLVSSSGAHINLEQTLNNQGSSIYFGDSHTNIYGYNVGPSQITAGEFEIVSGGPSPAKLLGINTSGAWNFGGAGFGTANQILASSGSTSYPTWVNTVSTIPASSITNTQLVNPSITLDITGGGTSTLSLGGVFSIVGDSSAGVSTSISGTAGTAPTVTITVANASTTSKGVAQFNSSEFTVASGVVSLASGVGTGFFTDIFFAVNGQTTFGLVNVVAQSRFPTGTISYVQVFVNGIQQREDNSAGNAYPIQGSFYVSGPSQIIFFVPLTTNDEVTVYQL